MKNYKIIFISTVSFIVLFTLINTSNKNKPTLTVGLFHSQSGTIHTFNYSITNTSKNKSKATFLKGDIVHYQIKAASGGYILDGKLDNEIPIVLNPGESFTESIKLDDLDSGEYRMIFWSISKEGTSPKVIKTFTVE